jgi:hypothetical protein
MRVFSTFSCLFGVLLSFPPPEQYRWTSSWTHLIGTDFSDVFIYSLGSNKSAILGQDRSASLYILSSGLNVKTPALHTPDLKASQRMAITFLGGQCHLQILQTPPVSAFEKLMARSPCENGLSLWSGQ